MARALLLGMGVGVLALGSEVFVLTFFDSSHWVHGVAAHPFGLINKPLEAILEQTGVGDSLKSAQDPLRSLVAMLIWWGFVGGILGLAITAALAFLRKASSSGASD